MVFVSSFPNMFIPPHALEAPTRAIVEIQVIQPFLPPRLKERNQAQMLRVHFLIEPLFGLAAAAKPKPTVRTLQ
jgi:hypothetical protein